jgi:hypothetical protein
MKTIKEWLMELPEQVRSRALKYEGSELEALKYEGRELDWHENTDSLKEAMYKFISWGGSSEGFYYWNLVTNKKYKEAEALLTPDTRKQNSREAHESVNKEKVQQVILDTLFACKTLRPEGMTKDEIADHSRLKPEQVHKRMSELMKDGKVEPNGKRKGNAGVNITIWKLI